MFVFSDLNSFEPGNSPSVETIVNLKYMASWSFIGHFVAIIVFNGLIAVYQRLKVVYKIIKKAIKVILKKCCKDKVKKEDK